MQPGNPRLRRLGLCTLAASTFAVAAAAGEKSLFETHFAGVANGEPCYARTYSASQLAEHPEQRVGTIELSMPKSTPDGTPISEDNIELNFGIKLKDTAGWYTSLAICKGTGPQIGCFLEGDGGSFTLTAAEDGGLKLSTGESGIAIEGETDVIEIDGSKGDDRIFLLAPGKSEDCAPAATAAKAPN